MIVESLSPLLRRILALGLALLAALLLWSVAVAPVVEAVSASRNAFAESRFRLARLQRMADAPPPPAPPAQLQGQIFRAPDRKAAEARLTALLRDLAQRQQLRLEAAAVPASAGQPGVIDCEIIVEGPAAMLTQWLYAIESGELLMRFDRAEMTSDGKAGGMARLSGRLSVVWGTGR